MFQTIFKISGILEKPPTHPPDQFHSSGPQFCSIIRRHFMRVPAFLVWKPVSIYFIVLLLYQGVCMHACECVQVCLLENACGRQWTTFMSQFSLFTFRLKSLKVLGLEFRLSGQHGQRLYPLDYLAILAHEQNGSKGLNECM